MGAEEEDAAAEALGAVEVLPSFVAEAAAELDRIEAFGGDEIEEGGAEVAEAGGDQAATLGGRECGEGERQVGGGHLAVAAVEAAGEAAKGAAERPRRGVWQGSDDSLQCQVGAVLQRVPHPGVLHLPPRRSSALPAKASPPP